MRIFGEISLVSQALRPLESRVRSAEKYYAPQEIQEEERPHGEVDAEPGSDGLGHHGDPEGQSVDEPHRDHSSPVVIRAPREPTQKERETHEATHLPHA